MRKDGREPSELRAVEASCNFQRNAEGSVLYRAGQTVVLATASIEDAVPAWMAGKGVGWLTAEYQMHPRSSPQRREARDGRGKAPSGRTQEIQRLIGRALRSAVWLDAVGERTIAIDCDVLEADGGTRTASITAGFIALVLALDKLKKQGRLTVPVLRDQVAAVSCGYVEDQLLLDLAYVEDHKARVDLNIVGSARGGIVEIQGTAEGEAMPRKNWDEMTALALGGVERLCALQQRVLADAAVTMSDYVRR